MARLTKSTFLQLKLFAAKCLWQERAEFISKTIKGVKGKQPICFHCFSLPILTIQASRNLLRCTVYTQLCENPNFFRTTFCKWCTTIFYLLLAKGKDIKSYFIFYTEKEPYTKNLGWWDTRRNSAACKTDVQKRGKLYTLNICALKSPPSHFKSHFSEDTM